MFSPVSVIRQRPSWGTYLKYVTQTNRFKYLIFSLQILVLNLLASFTESLRYRYVNTPTTAVKRWLAGGGGTKTDTTIHTHTLTHTHTYTTSMFQFSSTKSCSESFGLSGLLQKTQSYGCYATGLNRTHMIGRQTYYYDTVTPASILLVKEATE